MGIEESENLVFEREICHDDRNYLKKLSVLNSCQIVRIQLFLLSLGTKRWRKFRMSVVFDSLNQGRDCQEIEPSVLQESWLIEIVIPQGLSFCARIDMSDTLY